MAPNTAARANKQIPRDITRAIPKIVATLLRLSEVTFIKSSNNTSKTVGMCLIIVMNVSSPTKPAIAPLTRSSMLSLSPDEFISFSNQYLHKGVDHTKGQVRQRLAKLLICDISCEIADGQEDSDEWVNLSESPIIIRIIRVIPKMLDYFVLMCHGRTESKQQPTPQYELVIKHRTMPVMNPAR